MFHLTAVQVIQHCGFQATERKIIRCIFHKCTWEMNCLFIALFGKLVNLRSARISKSDCTCDLVKCLARCIISCPSYNLKRRIVLHIDQMGMSTGSYHAHKWRFQIRMLNIIRRNVSLDMMHTNQRFLLCISNRLCRTHTNQKCTYQSWSIRHCHGIDIVPCHMCFLNCRTNHLIDFLHMLPRCNLRHYAAIQLVKFNL